MYAWIQQFSRQLLIYGTISAIWGLSIVGTWELRGCKDEQEFAHRPADIDTSLVPFAVPAPPPSAVQVHPTPAAVQPEARLQQRIESLTARARTDSAAIDSMRHVITALATPQQIRIDDSLAVEDIAFRLIELFPVRWQLERTLQLKPRDIMVPQITARVPVAEHLKTVDAIEWTSAGLAVGGAIGDRRIALAGLAVIAAIELGKLIEFW